MINEFCCFTHKSNTAIYNKKYKHHGIRYRCIPFIEGNGWSMPFHIHAAIERPARVTEDRMIEIFEKYWKLGNVHVKRDDIGLWTKYISKQKQKDLYNYHYADSLIVSCLTV